MSRRKKLLATAAIPLLLLVGYLLVWPVPISPVAWEPPAAPALAGPYAANRALADVEILELGGRGPEDVDLDSAGRLYGGLIDGRIMRRNLRDGTVEQFADTGGRPLGLEFDAAGNLVVADADKGLLSVSPRGEITVLSTEHGGRPFLFTDDVDIASDGTIYFSDASFKRDRHGLREDFMDHRPYGRLLSYDPSSGLTTQLLDGLYFANGVAVADDDSFVLVNETMRYQVRRYWLKGSKAGTSDLLIDNLPGIPDGISRGTDGRFWIALYSPRLPDLDKLLPSPFLRKVVYRLPRFLQPDPIRFAFVLGIDSDGNVVANLQHKAPDSFSPITSVEEVDGQLYLGSLEFPGAARIPAP